MHVGKFGRRLSRSTRCGNCSACFVGIHSDMPCIRYTSSSASFIYIQSCITSWRPFSVTPHLTSETLADANVRRSFRSNLCKNIDVVYSFFVCTMWPKGRWPEKYRTARALPVVWTCAFFAYSHTSYEAQNIATAEASEPGDNANGTTTKTVFPPDREQKGSI